MPLSTGQMLNNRYRIVRLLGQGGFGAVYKAWDANLEEPVALKESFETSPAAQKQFQLEAKLLFKLRHSSLPIVHDFFVIPNQGMYLVMDYIEGQDLGEMLEQASGPLPESQVLPWIGQICDALDYLHSQNPPIIHRDLKPANIKITPNGQAILVDFGIAKVYDPKLATTVGARAVTPGYSPQEQYGMGSTDARTDVYALGATLYHLLTGQIPLESVVRTTGQALPAPRTLNPAISPQIESAILKAMQPMLADRYPSVAAFQRDLSTLTRPPVITPTAAIPQTQEAQTPPAAHAPGFTTSSIRPQPKGAHQSLNIPWNLAIPGVGVVVVLLLFWAFWPKGVAPSTADLTATASMAARRTQLALAQASTDTPTRQPEPSATPTATPEPNATPTDTPIPSSTPTNTPEPSPTPTETIPPSPTSLPQSITDEQGVTMNLVPAGSFLMGSDADDVLANCQQSSLFSCERSWYENEEPVHKVHLDAFYIDIYEVTNALYYNCAQVGVCTWPSGFGKSYGREYYYGNPQYDDYPVIYVTWEQAQEFCSWRDARLPTEAEWEKAARGGLEGEFYPWGDEVPDCSLANNSVGPYNYCVGDTSQVGSYSPNGYGLYDMAGNVSEWVFDWYQKDYYSSQSSWNNPQGPSSGEGRVLRGSSWTYYEGHLRAADRYWLVPSDSRYSIGFRCVRSK
ncbi:MAG: SUMF1/EgtB/PvdO family nonheme iron enzyme [Chloroflexota bacterium]